MSQQWVNSVDGKVEIVLPLVQRLLSQFLRLLNSAIHLKKNLCDIFLTEKKCLLIYTLEPKL